MEEAPCLLRWHRLLNPLRSKVDVWIQFSQLLSDICHQSNSYGGWCLWMMGKIWDLGYGHTLASHAFWSKMSAGVSVPHLPVKILQEQAPSPDQDSLSWVCPHRSPLPLALRHTSSSVWAIRNAHILSCGRRRSSVERWSGHAGTALPEKVEPCCNEFLAWTIMVVTLVTFRYISILNYDYSHWRFTFSYHAFITRLTHVNHTFISLVTVSVIDTVGPYIYAN